MSAEGKKSRVFLSAIFWKAVIVQVVMPAESEAEAGADAAMRNPDESPPEEVSASSSASSEVPAQEPPPPEEPEILDSLPLESDAPLRETPREGQLLEACPSCGTLMDVSDQVPFAKIHCPSCGQALRARKQFNHFKLLELIGQGGMGQVFKALDCNLNRLVALKVLKKELAASAEEREKLAAEARITASINHPHVVKVFSFGNDHGQFYMAMELIPNSSLDELLALQKRVPEMQVLQIGIQIAEGLQAALERELIHRDIKPGNILFADAHTAKLVDFGLAIVMDQAAAAAGEIWGTPYYIAPEKLDNQPEDFRSDIYSLGGTLFHALAGRPPYEAETASMVALKQLKSMPVSLQSFAPDVTSETAYVINRMIAKNADDRYPSYEKLIEHLTYAREKLVERVKSPRQPKARVVLETRETRNFAAWLSVVLLVVVLGVAGTLYHYRTKIFPALAVKAPETFVAADFDKAFLDAVALAGNRQFDEARNAFQLLADTPHLPGLQKNWVRMNLGLTILLAGDPAAAAQIFETVAQDGLFTHDEDKIGLAGFFVEAAKLLAQPDQVIDGRLYSPSGYEAFGLLSFGLHNWELGDLQSAEPLLRMFMGARPSGDYAWMEGYKTLVRPYVKEASAIAAIRRKLDAAGTPAAAAALLPDIEAARSEIITGNAASEALDRLAEKIQSVESAPSKP